jgi:transposase
MCPLVSSLQAELPGSGRDDGRTWPVLGAYDDYRPVKKSRLELKYAMIMAVFPGDFGMNSIHSKTSLDTTEGSGGSSTLSRSRPVRLVRADRRQLYWEMLDVERLVEEDHPVRAIWELVGQLDLSAFAAGIGSLEGVAGRPAYDPRLLVSLWIYSYSRDIGSAREVERRCEHDPGFRWLMGRLVINHHTLSNFRLAHRDALDEMFTQVLAMLSTEGLIALQTVMHDGTKITAQARPGSFRQEEQIVSYQGMCLGDVIGLA